MTAGTPLARAHGFALDQPVRRVATIVLAGIALLAVLGTLHKLGAPLALFDFDGEGKPLAAFSALILLSGGALGLLISRLPGEPAALAFAVLGAFLMFMAVDEAITLHEHVQDALNTDWQILWAPLVAIGGVAWLLVLRRIWPLERQRWLWLGGALAWLLSQIDEQIQSNPREGRVEGYDALSAVEETLEALGSGLFLLALLGTLHAFARAPRR